MNSATRQEHTPEIRQIRQKNDLSDDVITPEWLAEAEAALRVKQWVGKAAHPERKDQERTVIKKGIFLEVYAKTMGTVTLACERADINRDTFYQWKATDDEFAKAVVEIERRRVDMAEDRVFKLIQQDDGPTVRWYLERVSPKYKARQVLEHHTDDKTFEDEVDEVMGRLNQNGNEQQTTQDNEGAPEGVHRDEAEDTE